MQSPTIRRLERFFDQLAGIHPDRVRRFIRSHPRGDELLAHLRKAVEGVPALTVSPDPTPPLPDPPPNPGTELQRKNAELTREVKRRMGRRPKPKDERPPAQVRSDGLAVLAQAYSQRDDISYAEALLKVEREAAPERPELRAPSVDAANRLARRAERLADKEKIDFGEALIRVSRESAR